MTAITTSTKNASRRSYPEEDLTTQSGAAQTLAAVREYDAFGNVTSGTSTPDEGLKLLGHRYYDPSTGRFLTRDPIFDGRNWYSYGGGEGNPLTGIDPTGLKSVHAYIVNLWRTHKDPKAIIDMLKIALSGGTLTPRATKAAKEALEWYERYHEAIEAATELADWISSNGGAGVKHPNRPNPTPFRDDKNKLPGKGDYINYGVEERRPGQSRSGPRLIIDRKSGRKWFWDHVDKYLELP